MRSREPFRRCVAPPGFTERIENGIAGAKQRCAATSGQEGTAARTGVPLKFGCGKKFVGIASANIVVARLNTAVNATRRNIRDARYGPGPFASRSVRSYTTLRVMRRIVFTIAAAGIAFALEAAPRLELIAPRAGTVLDGDSETTLVWTAASLPSHVEEWEAFLSLDGGKYYGTRITPHLDAGRRSFAWRVPNVASSKARILIRIGDERDERVLEFAQTFTIVPRVTRTDFSRPESIVTDAEGESALPAAPPIVEWVSGDREGRGLVTHRHREPEVIEPARVIGAGRSDAFEHTSTQSSLQFPRCASRGKAPQQPARGFVRCARTPRPLLLLTTRLNI